MPRNDRSGSRKKASDLVREAVDARLLGASPVKPAQLDEASRRAEVDLEAMVKTLDANAKGHRRS